MKQKSRLEETALQNDPGKNVMQGYSNSSEVQRLHIKNALQASPNGLTTVSLRRDLDVMAPAARIFELRHGLGLNIQTVWDEDFTQAGRKHRVARYVLLPGRFQQGGDSE